MNAVRISAYRALPAVQDVLAPVVGAGDILVRVEAAGLNPLDVKIQQGFMHDFFPVVFPYTLGTDLSGTIEQIGPNVTGWSIGDKIVARTDPPAGGALAELAAVPATHLAKLPANVSFEQAAGVPTVAGTAWQALFEIAGLRSGQTVLIHAGAGGVGSFAIQLARNAGARVIATASGDGIATARRLGADQVIDYKAHAFDELVSDVDVVLDTIGGETQQRSFGVLRRGGYLASTASPPDEALAKAHGVGASFIFHQSDAPRLTMLLDQVAAGDLAVLIDRTLPMDRFDEAFARQASGRAQGKIIVKGYAS
ncbi:NADP-dependent oxidoreductase [Sphingomonas endolithica]|uniref:NADP-dependent oxidoreductase n=1 Tax=Sphingomonas endolithica TaxID=2972485 RepID=UPI0021AE772A|nr:NADP-dependent oxidoreductase [Sphingomonas sp. ZFBP2030]